MDVNRRRNDEKEKEHCERLRAEERYDVLRTLELRGPKKSVRYPWGELVI